MTMYAKQCVNCHQFFTATRKEAVCCSPRCTAAHARNEGYERVRIHEEKEEETGKDCAWCGKRFFYNDYAERGGKREAQYCSNRCRTAAYRARKKENAGYTGNWTDARNDKTKTRTKDTSQGTEKERQNYQDTQREQQQRSRKRAEETYKHTSQTPPPNSKHTSHQNTQTKHTSQEPRWKSSDPYVILGVTYVSTKAEIRSAWAKLAKQYHPDIYKGDDATVIMSAINNAYERLVKGYSRTRR